MGTVTTDLTITGLFSLVAAGCLSWWVCFTPQKEFPRSFRRVIGITVRTVLFYGVVWLLAGYGLGLRSIEVSIAASVVLSMLPVIHGSLFQGKHDDAVDRYVPAIGMGDVEGSIFFAGLMTVLFPLLLLREFIFGEPLDTGFTEKQSTTRAVSDFPSPLVGKIAVTVSLLRPSGMIDVDGQKISACSYTGAFIASGQHVQICGDRQGTPLVREIASQ